MSLGRAFYRVRQFLNLALPSLSTAEKMAIDKLLSFEQRDLFYNMSTFGQRHSLNVYHTLLAAGCQDADMLTAALLHDAGKEGVGITHRVACVLLQALCPDLLERWAAEKPGTWWHGLHINLHHAERGAALAKAAGASPLAVELIQLHQSKMAHDPRLVAFQQADEVN